MDEKTHDGWWPLHLKKAKGETLTQAEQTIYEAGKGELNATENYFASMSTLVQERSRTLALQAEYQRLKSEYAATEAKIAELEAQLSESTRQLLGMASG